MLNIPFLEATISRWFKPQALDDFVDRMNYFITATILGFFALLMSAKQYVGSPIQCWTPKEFVGGWDEFVQDYCFIQNTYYVPMRKHIPIKPEEIENAEISYYQWVPIVLTLQALMFFLPNWIWKTMLPLCGVDINVAVDDSCKLRNQKMSERKPEVTRIATYLADALEIDNENPRPKRMARLRYENGLDSFATMLYLCVKALYVANIVVQFTLLNSFLGHAEGWTWGFAALKNLHQGIDWDESGIFPRVTLCDFVVRKLGNNNTYTAQCVLMINMFNEKIFLFLWFWFFGLMFMTIPNFVTTLLEVTLVKRREKIVARLLEGYTDAKQHSHAVRRFVVDALKPDGLLILRFIENHSGLLIAKEIAQKLFQDFHLDMIKKDLDNKFLITPKITVDSDAPKRLVFHGEEDDLDHITGMSTPQ